MAAWPGPRGAKSTCRKLSVLYDGACPRCRASLALVAAADPDHVIEPIDLTAVEVSKVHPSFDPRRLSAFNADAVSAMGRITAGFDAVRTVASRLPLFWPMALIGFLPGVAWAGRRVYNWVAANRPRDIACTDQVCGIHSQSPRTVPRDGGRSRTHHNPIAMTTDTEEVPRS